jgi:uncharacterized protein (TIGR03437 family)
MRYLALLVAASPALFCQQFANGQAARLVIGQPTFTAQTPGPTSEILLGGASGLAYFNNMLFVSDASRVGAGPDNHRVLIYRDLESTIYAPTAPFPQGARCPACIGSANIVIGQPDFATNILARSQSGMRTPTGVATDGVSLAVCDTDNNRVLIWRSIPTRNGQPADVVIGQEDFTALRPQVVDNRSLRGPQGVWIQNGKLFVADTMNHRVLVWNAIPTQNNAPADLVLGQPNFNVAPELNLATQVLDIKANTMLNPVSVSSDGVRLYVSDLGHNRVLIWNSIPTQTQQPADIVLGQATFETALANNSSTVCESNGTDDDGNATYPQRCASTLNFPRSAISDGQRLFVADGGNDRVLVWNTIPTRNAQPADIVLGQLGFEVNNTSDSAFPGQVSATNILRGPSGLAWDGQNLFVSDTFNRRVLIFTPADPRVPQTGVRNAASFDTYAVGTISFGGEIRTDDEITLSIGLTDEEKEYKYKIPAEATFTSIIDALVALINADGGDPNVIATANTAFRQLVLTARIAGADGNLVNLSITLSDGATLLVSASSATLTGGQDAARLAPGTIVTIVGERLADFSEAAPEGLDPLPRRLGDTEVYFDGIAAPLLFVSPTQINAQLPWEVFDGTSTTAFVRTTRRDGSVDVSTAVAVPVIEQNPGIFALDGVDPRAAIAFHGSSFPSATVSVDGSIEAGDVAAIIIGGDRRYEYTVAEDDTLEIVRDRLIEAINNGNDPEVTAEPAGVFTRIRIIGRRPGPDLNGVTIAAEVNGTNGGAVILSVLNSALCCANVEGAPITADNPAVPGETIIVYATGLGRVEPEEAQEFATTGKQYQGPRLNRPLAFVSSLAGGRTANVLFSNLEPGTVGLYRVVLELNSDIPSNPETQLTIAQEAEVSNIVRIPVRNPAESRP